MQTTRTAQEPNFFVTQKQREKRTLRFQDGVQTDLRLEGLRLKIVSANPTTKQIVVSGPYADFLLAKKWGEKKELEFLLQTE